VIPADAISAWGTTRPWPDRRWVEQDLLLAAMIVAIYEHPLLSQALTHWGASCLHRVYLPDPGRYSEDLDFLRHDDADIGGLIEAFGEAARTVGLSGVPPQWRPRPESEGAMHMGEHIRLTFRAPCEDDPRRPLRLRVEVHPHDNQPARPRVRVPFEVDSPWFAGRTSVLTYEPAELVTTKLRGLCMRAKGRDLFDLWLGLTSLGVRADDVIGCFEPWRPDGCTAATAVEGLAAKLADSNFRTDLAAFVPAWPEGYDVDEAGALIRDNLLRWL
jgi:hypothetical protein